MRIGKPFTDGLSFCSTSEICNAICLKKSELRLRKSLGAIAKMQWVAAAEAVVGFLLVTSAGDKNMYRAGTLP